ncbi:DUF6099 family protein [Streptomyces sp. NPDC054796]|uniref:Uncharacterized protein n=1 Tax=Streptomyces daliensis TaxID=299421 RepID=A0A8T4IWL4_9ACTN|nr:hypothetical protein [Streptomyces daliensis]
MDAERLIEATRYALAESKAVPDIVAEAWQAQALAEAVGSHLAINGPPTVRSEALGLSEAGSRACGSLHHPALRADGVRATRLTMIGDARCTLLDLAGLLGETGAALVSVAVSADEEGLYWQCVEAIDAADESGDRVIGILRRLALRERGGVA